MNTEAQRPKLTKIDAWTLTMQGKTHTFVRVGAEWNGLMRLNCIERPSMFLIANRDPESGAFSAALGEIFGQPIMASVIAASPDLAALLRAETTGVV